MTLLSQIRALTMPTKAITRVISALYDNRTVYPEQQLPQLESGYQ